MSTTKPALAERMREHLTCYCPDKRCAGLLKRVEDLEASAQKMRLALAWPATRLKGNNDRPGCASCAAMRESCPVHEALEVAP